MDDRAKVVEKIVKLFELGQSGRGATEHEALLAVQKAQELMARHGIAMGDVEAIKGGSRKRTIKTAEREARTHNHRNWARFDQWLAWAVGKITTTVPSMQQGYKSNTMYFFGDEDDVAIAIALFNILSKEVRRLATAVCGKGWGTSHRCFAEGFAARVMERSREMRGLSKEEQQQWGLIVRDKEALVRAEAATRYRARRNRKSSAAHDGAAYSAGYLKGGSVGLNARHMVTKGE